MSAHPPLGLCPSQRSPGSAAGDLLNNTSPQTTVIVVPFERRSFLSTIIWFQGGGAGDMMTWPAWVYCTRYSDRPSSGRCENRFTFSLFMFTLHSTFKLLNAFKEYVNFNQITMVDPGSGRQGRTPPPVTKFFHFHAVFCKNLK